MNNGKKQEILVEFAYNSVTGELIDNLLYVWADGNVIDIIRSVNGVVSVAQCAKTWYAVTPDHRYDIEWLMAEIEGILTVNNPNL